MCTTKYCVEGFLIHFQPMKFNEFFSCCRVIQIECLFIGAENRDTFFSRVKRKIDLLSIYNTYQSVGIEAIVELY